MDQSTPGPPVFHCLLELGQNHVGRFDDTAQPSCSLSSPSPLALTLSQHQGLFQGVFSSHEMANASTLYHLSTILCQTVEPKIQRRAASYNVHPESQFLVFVLQYIPFTS